MTGSTTGNGGGSFLWDVGCWRPVVVKKEEKSRRLSSSNKGTRQVLSCDSMGVD